MTRSKTLDITTIALFAALISILSPFAIPIPISTVPISLATLALYITVYIAGTKKAFISTLIYLLLGLIGIPVFAGFTGGFGKLAGPTGGFLIGYLPMVLFIGLIIDHFDNIGIKISAYILGTLLLYSFGCLWFVFLGDGSTLAAAISLCVLPFIPGDIAKIAVTFAVCPALKKRLAR
ncbi:MAG: biotin transporter BioY [Lachnospiraceae bacterium]|nr:biotin transporter BioY [Lachnospiraceae bacterium]